MKAESKLFTEKELEILRLSDEAEELPLMTGRPKKHRKIKSTNKGGRPRKTEGDEKTMRRRATWRKSKMKNHRVKS